MLDETNNRVAQQVDTMIEASAKAHRDKIVENMNRPAPPPPPPQPVAPPTPPPPQQPANNYWFLNQAGQSASVPNNMVTFNTQVVTPGVNPNEAPSPVAAAIPDQQSVLPDEQQLMQVLEARKQELPMTAYYGHLHTIQPISAQNQAAQAAAAAAAGQQQSAPGQAPMPQQQPQNTTTQVPPGVAPPPSIQDSNQASFIAATAPQPVTPTQQTAILQLANNNDLNVATIAREAVARGLPDGEVVIKLH
jgi:hypothetical protein